MAYSANFRRLGAMLIAAALGLTAATAASAQSRTLADGRTASPAARVQNCQPAVVVADAEAGLHLQFTCRVPSDDGGAPDTDGVGQLMILTRQGTLPPQDFLIEEATRWWPDFPTWPQAQKDNVLSSARKTTASGLQTFRCIHRDNIDALDGDATCVLDTPGVQLVAIGKSSMALTADNVIDAMLAGLSLR